MSISGAIASSSAGRGPRGSFQGPMGYRRPSQHKDPGDLGTGKNNDKKKDQKSQGGEGSKSKSTCVLLVAMGMMTIWCLLSATELSSTYYHGNGG